MKQLNAMKATFGLLMDWLAAPIIWVFWPIRERWLGRNIANLISLARLPLMIWIMTKLPGANAQQTLYLILWVGVVQILDGLDGAVARGLGSSGPLGGAIDGGVDKINVLMFVGLLIQQLWTNGGHQVLIGISCGLLAGVVFLQICTIDANNQRRILAEKLHKEFRSRLPAQLFFIVSMLAIAGCWLMPNPIIASWMLMLSSSLMLFLAGWTLEDYAVDYQEQLRLHAAS